MKRVAVVDGRSSPGSKQPEKKGVNAVPGMRGKCSNIQVEGCNSSRNSGGTFPLVLHYTTAVTPNDYTISLHIEIGFSARRDYLIYL